MINVTYPKLLDLFREHIDPKRSESASFLIWYLENYYRLDTLEAIDAVCDQRGDKGVDGVYVNDGDQTITIFQSKISQNKSAKTGDKPLREFAGTLSQFETAEAVQNLIASAGEAQVAALVKRLDLVNKISTHELRAEFIANVEIDANGRDFLKSCPHIAYVGKSILTTSYVSNERNLPVHKPTAFDIAGFRVSEYIVDSSTKAIIAPVKANELVKLEGIADQKLFIYNVRGPLGRTQVNKDIVETVHNKARHKQFPLFHNGITIIAGSLDADDQSLTIGDYFVVNGCQSLTALYNNRGHITDDLRVLTKIIRADPQSALASMITEISNNQNGVKSRDFKANDKLQIRLQNEFGRLYKNQYAFEIKRGENPGKGQVISNENAGLFLMAFDLKEPWATHRKYQVFDDKHAALFGRPEVTADRIVMCQTIMEAIEDHLEDIENTLFGRYVLTRFLLMYIVRQLLEKDGLADEILNSPKIFVRDAADRALFKKAIGTLVGDIVEDLNQEVDEFGVDFDYRDKLRDSTWVRELTGKVVATHGKLVRRNKIQTFQEEWEESDKKAKRKA